MLNVYFVRHANTRDTGVRLSGRAPGVHLTSGGRHEARVLADALAPMGITHVYSSPLERAVETASVIANRLRRSVDVTPLFNEIDFGEWTGRAFTELDGVPAWTTFNTHPDEAEIPGGESPAAVVERGRRALCALRARHRHGDLAVVTHGDVIRLTLATLLSMPLGAFRRMAIAPASISCVQLGDETEPVLVSLNQRPCAAMLAEMLTS